MIAGGKELFKDFKVVKDRPVYIQLKDYLKKMIMKGHLLGDQKIPSTRELSELLSVSRKHCTRCLCRFRARRAHLCS